LCLHKANVSEPNEKSHRDCLDTGVTLNAIIMPAYSCMDLFCSRTSIAAFGSYVAVVESVPIAYTLYSGRRVVER
jgi:hypothetical protein